MIMLKRHSSNPIIKPRKDIWWESNCVFNAGVVFDGHKVHLLYRALGGDRISRFGYAASVDGVNFSHFKDVPVYDSDPADLNERLGAEDPRITKIGDTYYVVYCAASLFPATFPQFPFSASSTPFKTRVSMLSTKDFSTFERHGVILPDVDSKDGTLFPEKFDEQYILLHRIHPEIWITFSKDLTNWYDHKILISPRKNHWDSVKVGAGAPPIRTEAGWLLFYHGVDQQAVYRLGLLLLDLSDPTKVLYRSSEPILSPEEEYEKKGSVSNVVFTCGAIEKGGDYFVYYGAGDSCLGLATIGKAELMDFLTKNLSGD